jgi:UDP-N-acetylmuramate--alanine ligase
LKNIENIYFIGIGGIGMSALARYFIAEGKQVAGYDKTPSNITQDLQNIGATIHFDDGVEYIEESYLDATKTLVVYTPAIPNEHRELNYFNANGFRVLKRSEVLGLITENTICLAVSGTHGKTTTTSILGHLLKVCDVNMTAFLGGISENYNSNLIQNGGEVSVVEADEFDRSFLTLSPDYACITSMDADHLDIYGEKEALEMSFRDLQKI